MNKPLGFFSLRAPCTVSPLSLWHSVFNLLRVFKLALGTYFLCSSYSYIVVVMCIDDFSVFMYNCACTMYLYMYNYACTCIIIHVRTYVCTYMLQIFESWRLLIPLDITRIGQTSGYAVYVHVHMYIHMYMYTRTCTCIYTCMCLACTVMCLR